MAYCENCGSQMSDQATFCPQCGHPQRGVAAAMGVRRTEGSATASLVLGIAGLVFCPLVLSVLAIIFGNQAKRKIAADPMLEGEGMAKAGVVLGWIGIGLSVVWIFVFLAIAGGTAISAYAAI
jgi:hypothetical protein